MTITLQKELRAVDYAAFSVLARGLDKDQRKKLQPETRYEYSNCLVIEGHLDVGKTPKPRKTAGDAVGTLAMLLDLLEPKQRLAVLQTLSAKLLGQREVTCSDESKQIAKALVELTSGTTTVSPPITGNLRIEI